MLKTKRVYDVPDEGDGFRILVDRLWPRGLKRDKQKIDLWLKDIAPSDFTRKWFSHEPNKWPEFKERYFNELKDKKGLVELIREKEQHGAVSLLHSAKNKEFNNAVALKEYIEKKVKED